MTGVLAGRSRHVSYQPSVRSSPPPPAPATDEEHIYQEALGITEQLDIMSPVSSSYCAPWSSRAPSEYHNYPRYNLGTFL